MGIRNEQEGPTAEDIRLGTEFLVKVVPVLLVLGLIAKMLETGMSAVTELKNAVLDVFGPSIAAIKQALASFDVAGFLQNPTIDQNLPLVVILGFIGLVLMRASLRYSKAVAVILAGLAFLSLVF